MTSWKKGPPDYEAPEKGRRDRPVWVLTTDREGRSDGPTIGHLHGEFTEAFELERARSVAWLREGRVGPPPEITIVPWLNVPSLKADYPLRDWWNVEAWAEVPSPETVDALKGAVKGLCSIRDFLGVQLDIAWENLSDEEFRSQTEQFLRRKEGPLTEDLERSVQIVHRECGLDAETLSETFDVRLDDAILALRKLS